MDAFKGRGAKELGFAFVSLGRFRDMVWVHSTMASSASSMTRNFGELEGLLFELETMGVRFVAKDNVVCRGFLLGVLGGSICKLPARARRD